LRPAALFGQEAKIFSDQPTVSRRALKLAIYFHLATGHGRFANRGEMGYDGVRNFPLGNYD
jgi:hypothetical protein